MRLEMDKTFSYMRTLLGCTKLVRFCFCLWGFLNLFPVLYYGNAEIIPGKKHTFLKYCSVEQVSFCFSPASMAENKKYKNEQK